MDEVLLVSKDPHPGEKSHLVTHWWGRRIVVGEPKIPTTEKRCGTPVIWPIVGPPEFVDFLHRLKLGFNVCAHQIDWENGDEEHPDA